MTDKPKRCHYCLGKDWDHECGEFLSCGICCATHGGLTVTDQYAYGWVERIIAAHNGALAEIEKERDELLAKCREQKMYLDLGAAELKKLLEVAQ